MKSLWFFLAVFSLNTIAFSGGTFAADSKEAALKKKGKELETPYGEGLFADFLTNEDEEISSCIRSMREKGKSDIEIGLAVEKIKEKYKIIRERMARRVAIQACRDRLKESLAKVEGKTDLRSFIERELLKKVLCKTGDRSFLDFLQQHVDDNFSHLAPLYKSLNGFVSEMSEVVREAKLGGRSAVGSEVLKSLIMRAGNLSKNILEDESIISFKRHRNPQYRGIPEKEIPDREWILKEKKTLLRQIKRLKSRALSNEEKQFRNSIRAQEQKRKSDKDARKKAYKEAFYKLKAQVLSQLDPNSDTIPLKKAILEYQLKMHAPNRQKPLVIYADELEQKFNKSVENHLRVSFFKYQELEKANAAVRALTSTPFGEINWDSKQLSESQVDRQIKKLICSLQSARESRMGKSDFRESRVVGYHGDYKATENEANLILRSFARSTRNQKLLEGWRATQNGLIWLGKGAGLVIASPILGLYYIGSQAKNFASDEYQKHLDSNALKEKYSAVYLELKERVKGFENSAQISPLEKDVLRRYFKTIPSSGTQLNLLRNFDSELSTHIVRSYRAYRQVDDQVKAVTRMTGSPSEEIDWDHAKLSNRDICNSINYLINSLERAQATRKIRKQFLRYTDSFLSTSELAYSGNFQETEARAVAILKSFSKSKRNQDALALMEGTAGALKEVAELLIVWPGLGIWYLGKSSVHYLGDRVRDVDQWRKTRAESKQNYALQYDALKSRVNDELSSDTNPPLMKKIILRRFEKISQSGGLTQESWQELRQFDRNVQSHFQYSSFQYLELEKRLHECEITRNLDSLKRLFVLAKESQTIGRVEGFQNHTEVFEGDFEDLEFRAWQSIQKMKIEFRQAANAEFRERLSKGLSDSWEVVKGTPGWLFQRGGSYFKSLGEWISKQRSEDALSEMEQAAWKAIQDAKMEIEEVQKLSEISKFERIYVQKLKLCIRGLRYQIKKHETILPEHLNLIQVATREAESEYANQFNAEKERQGDLRKYWADEEGRRKEVKRKQGEIDNQIKKLLGQFPTQAHSHQSKFGDYFPSFPASSRVLYPILERATHDLSQGKWNSDKEYTISDSDLERRRILEGNEAYAEFIQYRMDEEGGVIVGDLPESGDEEEKVANPENSKMNFLKHFVSLPEFPSLDDDANSTCTICFERVEYDFRPLRQSLDVPPEYDELVQVPLGPNSHKLSNCGHLIHKNCLEGLMINRGLATFSCPKCRKPIPFYELDRVKHRKKYHFDWN